uniref:DNA-directed RNA polymerase n=1 Tax=viral metagenome TaxID=1070528 RepID=A0A6C0HTC4_9ZZZZ
MSEKVLSYFDDERNEIDSVGSEDNFEKLEEESDIESIADDLSEESDFDNFNLDKNLPEPNAEEAPNDFLEETKIDSDDDFDIAEDDTNYLQKFTKNISENYLADNHPECIIHNNVEIDSLSSIVRDDDGIIIDKHHQTLPILTKYERARIIGERAKQINNGATPFIEVPPNIIDGYIIAELELAVKKIPFIIQRPLPNGSKEFWKLVDLEIIE